MFEPILGLRPRNEVEYQAFLTSIHRVEDDDDDNDDGDDDDDEHRTVESSQNALEHRTLKEPGFCEDSARILGT